MKCIKHKKGLPELLAPAGSFAHLAGIFRAGADAVYLGGEKFGARAYAKNFTREELTEAVGFAHLYDRKVYLTVNTLMREEEVRTELYDFLSPLYEAGLDGVIVQDLGAASLIRDCFPYIEIHGSTQMNITSVYGAGAAARMGMNRIVPARELSLHEIKEIKRKTGLETEVFIHGALCYCYSGQCLLSSWYGGRSGNRGQCAQPCRLPYRLYDRNGKQEKTSGSYLLSPRDLCTLTRLPDLIEAGVDSFKIEGRMKNLEYVTGVTACYRKYMDAYQALKDKTKYRVDEKDLEDLSELFSRSGFTDGYLFRHNGAEMMSVRHPNYQGIPVGRVEKIRKNFLVFQTARELHAKDILVISPNNSDKSQEIVLTVPDHLDQTRPDQRVELKTASPERLRPGMEIFRRRNAKLTGKIHRDILGRDLSRPVFVRLILEEGEKMQVMLSCGNLSHSLEGPVPAPARERALTREDIEKQFAKTGNTPFYLAGMRIRLAPGLFMPLSVLKDLRQRGYAGLAQLLRQQAQRKPGSSTENLSEKDAIAANNKLPSGRNCDMIRPKLVVTVYTIRMLRACLRLSFGDDFCFPADFWDEASLTEALGILKEVQKPAWLSLPRILREGDPKLRSFFEWGWKGFYVHNINQAELLFHDGTPGIRSGASRLVLGSSLYQWNTFSHRELFRLYGANFQTLISEFPTELPFASAAAVFAGEVKRTEQELLLFGRIPLMLSTQCPAKTVHRCSGQPDLFYIEDRRKRRLPVTTHCDKGCYSMIWSDQPLNRMHREKITAMDCPGRLRVDLFLIKEEQLPGIRAQYRRWYQERFPDPNHNHLITT